MTRFIFTAAFVLGASVIIWMGAGFVGLNTLALTIISVIACVYMVGFIELTQFRKATATLSLSLSKLPGQIDMPITSLDEWLFKLHPSLQNSVRLRIEGERVALPAPVLSPYLVGLLVMLGLLGTFAGMVDTLKGAVIALEGTTELQAVRAGLAAPIKGLGLAFGTSVAGVAASAMLGLLSTLSRRERMLATRMLDSKISTVFRDFSLSFNRQETYKALQNQAQAFPEVVGKIELLASQVERMANSLGDKLTSEQELFHKSVKNSYTNLASTVGESLRESLSVSGRLTSEAILPVFKEAIAEISEKINTSVDVTHQNLSNTVESQLKTISEHMQELSEKTGESWKAGLVAHESSNKALLDGVKDGLQAFNQTFHQKSVSVIESFDRASASVLAGQEQRDKDRLILWTESLREVQAQSKNQLEQVSKTFVGDMEQSNVLQRTNIEGVTQKIELMSSSLMNHWQQASQSTISQQEKTAESIKQVALDISEDTRSVSGGMLTEIRQLLQSSERLMQARVDTESIWLKEHNVRMQEVSSVVSLEFNTLLEAQDARGLMAIERLSELEETVGKHLAVLGSALEAPMTRLIETASETPRAAAEVISHLRHEISKNIERDNSLLEERERILIVLNKLFSSLEQTSVSQRDTVETLVNSSANMLKDVGARFTGHIESEVSKLSEITDHFSGSASEMASLGDAFSKSVSLFNKSTGCLIENLSRIEESLEASSTKSDDQMAYYVAQAREIIDQSMLSQQEIIGQLRQIDTNTGLSTDRHVAAEEV